MSARRITDSDAGDDAAKRITGDGLVVDRVTVTYRNGHTALRDASCTMPSGTISALVGINGAGKSTLFKAVMGFVPLAEGSVSVFGGTVKEARRKNRIAYVPQAEEVDWTFPVLVRDVVMMGRYGHMGWLRRSRPVDHEKVADALARVGMEDYASRQIGELSGGQKKRVFLARALAQEADLVLLDEPFTGVDIGTEERIIALLRELRDEGCIVLVSTHDLGSVPEYCDRTVFIKGTVLASGPTQEVFNPENLKEAFGGSLRHFVLAGTDLHEDQDERHLTVITDEERPFVLYGDERQPYKSGDDEAVVIDDEPVDR
ncbi:manganese/iron ABC transporter ATP-binding protein [Notoacmeibacter sp. MSK16QG-6]|uniref:manganese/iron ABC transporter ATP-binding protein n=1 Tax=Notoacmeibacter sp. MSK16QG-6 TaxID=2957982 RepID=UPI00209D07FC|nr:manganese/iron ABC transporter ATP-binding protein [Notoacmeibacter sp. MSK16QG-6]MCP1200034.1 manganese/iron ABC transporter ATP-binding protein [Notoacmeibacter sp. MSK16QG-6]